MKKFLKVTALSATACALLGTVPVSAEESTGITTVTYEPGYSSPTGASWGVSFTASVALNNSNIASTFDGTTIQSKGQAITFTVVDADATTHTSKDQVKVSLASGTTGGMGRITMDVTGTDSSSADVKMALAKSNSSSGSYDIIIASGTDAEIATLENNESGSSPYTTTIYAAITDDNGMLNSSKASKDLTFKFEKQ